MSDLSALQSRILYFLSSSREPQLAMDVLHQKLEERPERVSAAVRELLENRRITLHQSDVPHTGKGKPPAAQQPPPPPKIYVQLAKGDMSESFSLVYEAIRESGASGMDQQQLASRLRIPKSDILKALRSLTQSQRIQEQRSFTNRAKKIYLLFHLQPSAQVTGGTLYCGEDLDVALVDELRQRIVSFVSRFRTVGLRQIESFVEEQTTGGGTGLSPDADRSADNARGSWGKEDYDLDAVERRLVKRERDDECDEADLSWQQQEQRPSSPIAFIHSSGGTNPSRPPSASPSERGFPASPSSLPLSQQQQHLHSSGTVSLAAKQIQAKDVRVLLQTLVLDGVVEELLGPFPSYYSDGSATDSFYARALGHEPRYQLATGGNVMRHFTAFPRQCGSGRGPTPAEAAERQRKRARGEVERSGVVAGDEAEAVEAVAAPGRTPATATRQKLASLLEAMEGESLWGPADISKPSSCSPTSIPGDNRRVSSHHGWAYMPAVGFPCLGCPQLANCSATGHGTPNRRDCLYLAEWLR